MIYVAGFIVLAFGALLVIGAKRNLSILVDPPKSAALFYSQSLLRLLFDLDPPAMKRLTIIQGAVLTIVATIIMVGHAVA
jgi:hypothetical protein